MTEVRLLAGGDMVVIGYTYETESGAVMVCVKVNHDTGQLWFLPQAEYERRFAEATP